MTAALAGALDRAHGHVAPLNGRVYLHPGQMAAVRDTNRLTTILGSCVGVCLHDATSGIVGLNHFLLPIAPAGAESERYGDIAMWRLISAMRRLGADPRRMAATVAGGACVLDAFQGKPAHLGLANIRIAFHALAEAGIRITARHIEGNRGRRLTFQDGRVAVRVL